MSLLPGIPPEGSIPPSSGGFDPDAYLAKKQEAAFDPNAYLEAKLAEGPKVGAAETFGHRTVAALPLGTQIKNALGALWLQSAKMGGVGKPGVRLTSEAAAEAKARGMSEATESSIPGLAEGYGQLRDTAAARDAAGARQNHNAALAGTGFGTALALLAPGLPKVSVGSGALGRVASSALTGGAYGTVNGAANSKGDLLKGEVGQVLSDAVGLDGLKRSYGAAKEGRPVAALLDLLGSGGIGGTIGGGVTGGLMEGARATGVPQAVAGWVKGAALDKGRKVLTNGADQLSTRNAVPDAAVEEAIRSGAIKPMGTNQGAADRLGKLTEQVGDEYGRVVSELEARGVSGPDAKALADQLVGKGAALERNTMNDALPREYLDSAEKLIGKAGPNGKLGLTQGEDLKRSLQRMAKYGRVEETPLNEVRKDIASVVRQANENAISGAAKANPALEPLASQFEPVKRRLGNLLEAESAAQRGAARGAQRGAGSDFGIKASAAAVASGQPGLIPAAMASNFARARLPSTLASGGLTLADLLGGVPGRGGKEGQVAELLSNLLQDDDEQRALAEALRKGKR